MELRWPARPPGGPRSWFAQQISPWRGEMDIPPVLLEPDEKTTGMSRGGVCQLMKAESVQELIVI